MNIEESPSGQTVCNECHEKIAKGELRYNEVSGGGRYGKNYNRYHARCAKKHFNDLADEIEVILLAHKSYKADKEGDNGRSTG